MRPVESFGNMTLRGFLNAIKSTVMRYIFIVAMSLMACTKQTEQFIVPDDTTHILQGQYTVDYKTIEQPTGTLIFAHEGSSQWANRTGQIMPDMHQYATDSLYFYQGGSTGAVRIKYKDGIPTQVGCRKVVSASHNHIAWQQDDWVITYYYFD